MAAPELRAGDEVRVFDQNDGRMGQPEGGWPGVVTNIGRKLIRIEYRNKVDAFRLDTGRINDNYGHRWFKTMEQVAESKRRSSAMAVLNAHKISLDFGHRLTLEQIEALAELARTF